MKIIIGILVWFSITSCGWWGRTAAKWTGYDEFCVDGVKYIQFTSGASVKYSPEGRVVTCK